MERPSSIALRVDIKNCALIAGRHLRDCQQLAERGDLVAAQVHRDIATLASLHAFELSRQLGRIRSAAHARPAVAPRAVAGCAPDLFGASP
jgi:hypothetical protein